MMTHKAMCEMRRYERERGANAGFRLGCYIGFGAGLFFGGLVMYVVLR
jgi:hypothetical protein